MAEVEVEPAESVVVAPVSARDAEVGPLLAALTAELADGGYSPEQTFGYSVSICMQLTLGG